MTTKTFLSKQMFVYAKAFPNFKPDPDIVDVYFLILEDIPDEVLAVAFKDAIATADPRNAAFFPSAGTLRASATKIMTAGMTGGHALEAWGKVRKLMQRYGISGWHQAAAEMDDITRRTAEAIGWAKYGNSDEDDEMSWRARFCELYVHYQKVAVDDVRMLPETKSMRNQIASEGVASLTKALTAPTNGSIRR